MSNSKTKDVRSYAVTHHEQTSKALAARDQVGMVELNAFSSQQMGNKLLRSNIVQAGGVSASKQVSIGDQDPPGSKSGSKDGSRASISMIGNTKSRQIQAQGQAQGSTRVVMSKSIASVSKDGRASITSAFMSSKRIAHSKSLRRASKEQQSKDIPRRRISLADLEWRHALLAAYRVEALNKILSLRRSAGWTSQGKWKGIEAIASHRLTEDEPLDDPENSASITYRAGSKLATKTRTDPVEEEEDEILTEAMAVAAAEPDHPASYTVRELGLLENFTRLEPIQVEGTIPAYLSKWKYVSLASMQLTTMQEYRDVWRKLQLLMPPSHLNWIADQFYSNYIMRHMIQPSKPPNYHDTSIKEEDGEIKFDHDGVDEDDSQSMISSTDEKSGFGWISIDDLQPLCASYIQLLYPETDLSREDQGFKPSQYLKALELAYAETPPVQDINLEFPFDIAVVIIEISRLLWLQSAKHCGWSEMEVKQLQHYYGMYDRDGQGLKSQKTFELLKKIGIYIEGDEQGKMIDLIKECDLNNDGVTSFEEFLYILKRFQDKLQAEELEAAVEAADATHGLGDNEALNRALMASKERAGSKEHSNNVNNVDSKIQFIVLPDIFLDELQCEFELMNITGNDFYSLANIKTAIQNFGFDSADGGPTQSMHRTNKSMNSSKSMNASAMENAHHGGFSKNELKKIDTLRADLGIPAAMKYSDIVHLFTEGFQQNIANLREQILKWCRTQENARTGGFELDQFSPGDLESEWWPEQASKCGNLMRHIHNRTSWLEQRLKADAERAMGFSGASKSIASSKSIAGSPGRSRAMSMSLSRASKAVSQGQPIESQ